MPKWQKDLVYTTFVQEKAESSGQFSIIDNDRKISSNLVYLSNEKLSDIVFNSEDNAKVSNLRFLDTNKCHRQWLVFAC